MAAIPRAGEGSGELAAFSGGLWAPRSSLLPVLSGLSGGEWSLARVCCARPPGNWGCSPACSGSRCDLPPCVPAGHELDAHSASAGGGAVCRFPCSKGADGAPATLGCFRRLEERWQSFSWELAGLCLAPSWSFHATCHAEDTVGAGEEGPGVCGTLSPICGHFCGLLVLVSPVS